jgi:hypothetical protein
MENSQKHMRFHTELRQLQDFRGNFISLEDLNKAIESKTPKVALEHFEKDLEEVEWQDLLLRIPKQNWIPLLLTVSEKCQDSCQWTFQFTHPRHDAFVSEIEYLSPLLPTTLLRFERPGFSFEPLETAVILDPGWQKAVNQGEISYEDIESISLQANNVIQAYRMQVRLRKTQWRSVGPAGAPFPKNLLTPDVRRQLQEQHQAAIERGEVEKAAVIAKTLNGFEDSNEET